MRGFIGLCLLVTGLSIGAYSHYPGSAQREASLVELTEIVTGAIHKPSKLTEISGSAHAAEPKARAADQTPLAVARDIQAASSSNTPFQRRGWFANPRILTASRDTPDLRKADKPKLVAAPTRLAAHQRSKARVLSIEDRPTLIRSGASQQGLSGGWRTAVVRVDATSKNAGKRSTSLKPKTDAERWRLVKSIQTELKRVGCYWGRVDGIWGKGSKWAMADFMRSVNAALPTKNPDYIQLKLVSSHVSKVCGRKDDGTQIAVRLSPPVVQTKWRAKVARVNGNARGSDVSHYTTGRVTTGTLRSRPDVVAVQQHPHRAPLPGRMAIGALQGPPQLVKRPKSIRRQVKVSALAQPNVEVDSVRYPAQAHQAEEIAAKRARQADPFVAAKRSAAKAKRAKALRKAAIRKQRRRQYRKRRYRRRSVQSMFMHPLGRR